MEAKALFYQLAGVVAGLTLPGEVFTCSFSGEDSNFVRLNANRVRQAGHVRQRSLTIDLIEGERHATGTLTLGGDPGQERQALRELMAQLRSQREHLAGDPYLNFATAVNSTDDARPSALPDPGAAIGEVIRAAEGLDLVGIWCSGPIHRGFANSFGQRNWYEAATFNLDWSCYHAGDKAVKCNVAGFDWDGGAMVQAMERAREQLKMMTRAPRTIAPGRYRVYLAPQALGGLLELLGWGGFGLKSHRTRATPLLKMVVNGRRLHPSVHLSEDHAGGIAPPFTGDGFIKPERVALISGGAYRDTLADPRSAKEYQVPVNAESETPHSLHMTPGDVETADILERLGTGVYISEVWYCNYADPNDCRITGMTRFASFWVENGEIAAPLEVMRFDDSLYNILGSNLIGLTREADYRFDPDTYFQRSTSVMRLPGALVDDFNFAL